MKRFYYIFLVFFVLTLTGWAFRVQSQTYSVRKVTEEYTDTLRMDLYLPDLRSGKPRPVFIFVHGGGFSGGRYDLPSIEKYCRSIAEKGWVAVSIEYHLTRKGKGFNCNTPAEEKMETFRQSGLNVNEATAFLLAYKNGYVIDDKMIVLAGSSAGAEAVLHAAYWNKTGRVQEGEQKILPENFQYAGIVSMAGALADITWMNEENALPTLFFHGTCDNLVPYQYASHHYCDSQKPGYLPLYGPHDMVGKMKEWNTSWYFVSDCGGDHGWSGKPLEPAYAVHTFAFLESLKNGKKMAELVHLQEGNKTCNQYAVTCPAEEEEGTFPLLLILAGLLTGIINTLAGSGTIVSIGALILLGYPAVLANTTNRPGVLVQNVSGLLSMRWFGKLKFRMDYPILFAILTGSLLGSLLAVKIPNAGMEWIAASLMGFILLSKVVDLKKNSFSFCLKRFN